MTYLKADSNKVPENIITKATSLAIATLLITSLFVWVIPITPAYAVANATITASGATAPWQADADFLIQISVSDPDFAGDGTSQDNILASITLKNAAGGTVGSTGLSVAVEEVGDSGQFILGLGASGVGSSATTFATAPSPWTASYYNVTDLGAVEEDGTVEVSYQDASGPVTISVVVEIDNVTPVISSDRAEYPPGGVIHLNATDQDLNSDPTAVNSSVVTLDFSVLFANGTASTGSSSATFTENDVNSKIFENATNLEDIAPIVGTTAFVNGDLLTIEFNDPVGGDKADFTIEIKEEDGVVVLPATFTYGTELEVQVIDFDRNNDTLVKDAMKGNETVIQVLNGTTLYDAERLNLTETDVNTSTFKATIDVTWAYSTVYLFNGTLEIKCGMTVKVGYEDPSTGTNTSEVISSLACVDPTLSTDTPTRGPGLSVQLTLDNPNANDDKDTRETIVSYNATDDNTIIQDGASLGTISFNSSKTIIGNMTIKVQEGGVGDFKNAFAEGDFTLVFRETGEDTGTYTLTAKLDLDNINNNDNEPLADGDIVEICWQDFIDPDEPTCITITISAVEATITLDRATYPVTRDTVKVYVSINDQDANTNDNAVETITLGDAEAYENAVVNRINGTVLLNMTSTPITLEETTPSSGIFEATINVDQTSEESRAWINAELVIEYNDTSAAKTVKATATFVLNDVSISVNATTVSYGQAFKVTVTDLDNDLDSRAKETLTKYLEVEYDTTSLLVDLKETGNSTGVFEKTLTVGDEFSPTIGKDITLKYNDTTSITAAPTPDHTSTWPANKTVSVKLSTTTQTGVLALSTVEFGPGTKVNITLTDYDLNTKIDEKDTTTVRIKTTTNTAGITVTLTETALNSGFFTKKVQIGGTGADIAAAVGDLVQVVYLDAADAEGNARSVIVDATVRGWDPVMTFDQTFYNPDEVVTITVNDFDANLDPDLRDHVNVTIVSDSDPIGLSLPAWETDKNTGNFSVSFTIRDQVEAETLFVTVGDTITVTYTDKTPEDYPETEKKKDFTATVKVGVELPPTERVPASTPETVDTLGNPVVSPSVGTVTVIQAQVCNDDTVTHTFTFIVQVKDANGVVVAINWIQDLTLAAGACAKPGVSWTPESTGQYTIEVYVWTSLTEAVALSPVFTKTVTVV